MTLQPAASAAGGQIPSGGTISSRETHAEVGLDQLFDTLNGPTRKGLANIVKGEATSIGGKTAAANRTLVYLDPLLQSTSQVTAALDREEPAFDQLLVKGAQTMQALSSRSQQLTDLVSRSDAVTGTVASQSAALAQTLALLPGALSESTTTFTGLRKTIAALEPLVAATKPQVKQLTPFATALGDFATTAVPTLTELATLISNRGGGDLITLLQEAPALERAASSGFAAISASLKAQTSSGQIQALRQYTPDIVAALANVGQLDGYYDANGHYGRAEPFYGAYGIKRRHAHRQLAGRPLQGPDRGQHRPLPRLRNRQRRRIDAGQGNRLQPRQQAVKRVLAISATVVVVGVVAWLAVTALSGGGSGSYRVQALFDNAGFAVPGEQVRIAGAPVGTISSLAVTRQKLAAVTLTITNRDFVPWHANASCTIRPSR